MTTVFPALILGTLFALGCETKAQIAPRPIVRLAGNTTLSVPLAREYPRVLPGVDFEVVPGGFEALLAGKADFGFVLADWAYFTQSVHLKGDMPPSFGGIQGIAVLQVTPLHFVVRRNSGIENVADLKGRSVRVASVPIQVSSDLIHTVLAQFGVPFEAVQIRTASIKESIRQLTDGVLDAMFVFAFKYPLADLRAGMERGVRLLPIEGSAVERIRQEYPFVRLVSIPAGTYPGQTEIIHTIGVDGILVCRSELDERLVYDLTKQFLEVVYRKSVPEGSDPAIDLTRTAGTPIPLHKGAALYYRDREVVR